MSLRRRLAALDLIALLLVLAMLEVTLRLAVPVLRPTNVRDAVPGWHTALTWAGVFMLHLTSTLALGVAALQIWEASVRRDLYPPGARLTIAAVGAGFLALTSWSIFVTPSPSMTFFVETSFVALLVLAVAALAVRRGDPLVKVGLLVVAAPFLVHWYGTFRLQPFIGGEAARWSPLPDRIREIGQWTVAMAAMATPLCFAPRPLARSLTRPGPLVTAAFVGTIGAVILRRHYEVGMELASRALGVELGPGAPVQTIALYVTAACMAVWTLTATFTADSAARRLIGMGFALVVVSGYSFEMPVQFLCTAVGVLAIARGGAHVVDEEIVGIDAGPRFSTPPIPDEAWRGYVDALSRALGAEAQVRREAELEETALVGRRREVPFSLRVLRSSQGLHAVEATFGAERPSDAAPAWTLFARPEGLLATGVHPPPPANRGSVVRTGDASFDRRFKLKDESDVTSRLFDDGLRARATAVLDGWVAVWPGRALVYSVCPGRGAPLDHPIPVTELAFRGAASPAAAERLAGVLDLLAEIAGRALVPPAGESIGP